MINIKFICPSCGEIIEELKEQVYGRCDYTEHNTIDLKRVAEDIENGIVSVSEIEDDIHCGEYTHYGDCDYENFDPDEHEHRCPECDAIIHLFELLKEKTSGKQDKMIKFLFNKAT